MTKPTEQEIFKEFAVDGTVDIPDVEIFKVGTWNKDTYQLTDLAKIVHNYNQLKDRVKPPLKLGHDDGQKFAGKMAKGDEGKPAWGWVNGLKIMGDTLVANFADVPKKLAELIKQRQYRRVSSEIYPRYETEGNAYEQVLRAVALLGGDIPAVDTLADIPTNFSCQEQNVKVYSLTKDETHRTITKTGAKMGKFITTKAFNSIEELTTQVVDSVKTKLGLKEDTTGVATAVGASIAEAVTPYAEPKEETPEEKKKREEAEAAAAEKAKKNDELIAENTTLKTKLAELEGAKKTVEEKATAAETKVTQMEEAAKKSEIDTFVAKLKTEGKIFARQEEEIKELLYRADNKQVKKFSRDGKDVEMTDLAKTKSLFDNMPKIALFTELGKDGDITIKTEIVDKSGRVMKVKDADVDMKAKLYAKEHNVPYEKALLEVSKG